MFVWRELLGNTCGEQATNTREFKSLHHRGFTGTQSNNTSRRDDGSARAFGKFFISREKNWKTKQKGFSPPPSAPAPYNKYGSLRTNQIPATPANAAAASESTLAVCPFV